MGNIFEKINFKKIKKEDLSVVEQNELFKDLETGRDILKEEEVYSRGLVKVLDLIAPSAMGISSSYLQIGNVFARTIFVVAYPNTLSMGWLNRVIGMDIPMDISIFIQPVNTNYILKKLRKKTVQVQSEMRIEAEKGQPRDPVLEMAYANVENLRDKLQEGSEKFFNMGVYFTVFGRNEKEMDEQAGTLEALLNARSIYTKKAVFRMKEGFTSTIPLGLDKLNNTTPLNTSPVSTVFPFISADITSNDGILYGINQHNNSLILFDRFTMENANMVVFAKSGAGKSFLVKLEILRSMMLGTNVIVIDPENEYEYLAEVTGSSFISISLNSKQHINPFDLPEEEGKEMKELLRSNIAVLLGLFKIMLGSLMPEEEAVLEQAIRETYGIMDINENTTVTDLKKKNIPLLTDLYEVLRNMDGGEDMTMRLKKYTEGIFEGFVNQPTNISLDNQLVVFNIRDLEEELRPIAMYLVLHYIWNRIRSDIKKRLVVADEAWVMMEYEEAANFMFAIAKRIRKYYGGLTTITQDINDFMTSKRGKAIVSNSSIQVLMRQSQSTIDIVADTFYLTDQEKYFLSECNVGEGIFFAGSKRAAMLVVASHNEEKIVTTKPSEVVEREKKRKEQMEE
jgi:type IV secretory pathway VirB4 component